MLRVGVQFELVRIGDQNRLDRYVFAQMQRETREYRHVGAAMLQHQPERRESFRVSLAKSPPGEEPAVMLSGQDLLVATRGALIDISGTGCGIQIANASERPSGRLKLHLMTGELDLAVDGRVKHVRQEED